MSTHFSFECRFGLCKFGNWVNGYAILVVVVGKHVAYFAYICG